MPSELQRRLGLLDALAILVGVTIGGGIFLVPNLVAQNLSSQPAILGIWAFAGLISFFGALGCAELGTALPATGGQYVFIREAYGPLAGFLCGWSSFVVARSAQVSWLAVAFSLYLSYFVPVGAAVSKLAGVGIVAVCTWINYRGVRTGAAVQKTFTLAKLAGLLIIIASAFLLGGHAPAPAAAALERLSLSHFGVALIACLLAYDGWVQVSFVAGEIRNPQRNVLLALALGTAACIAIYVLANLAYLHVLSIPEIAASDHVGASAAQRVLGPAGGTLVSLIILISIVSALNGCFLTTPRIYFRSFARVHPRYQTPGFAIVAQGVWASVLVLSGTFETLADYAIFALWAFYGLMVAGVIVLRRKRPDLPRPYRMWGYPITPLLFLTTAVWFLGNMLITRPGPSFAGLILIATGVPVYFVWHKKERKMLALGASAPDTRPNSI
jgi:APA family basic amino acid/polyamine antiporter